ncbi:hypothetical protein SUGI_0740670 [Cryptomeria japonica]|nr:hypothetical protein SUGI_0740670 [Cryptomeria japonica]
MGGNKDDPNCPKNTMKSQESLTSQESSLMSQSSLYSEHSLKSVTSLQSEFSLRSQPSIQSYNSLASVPSIGTTQQTSEGCYSYSYRCIATVTVEGQGGNVFSLATAEADLVYSGSSGSEIRVWKKNQAELIQECGIMGQGKGKAGVKCIVVAGDRIYSAHQDHRIRVWRRFESQQHKLVASVPTIKDYLMTFMVPRNHVKVRRHRKVLWIQHVDTISALAVDRKGFLYSASWDRTVKIWRPSDFRCIESFRAHDDAINALVVSGDGFLYTGSADARVKVWNKAPGEKRHSLVATLERHKSSINALALSASDSALLYSGACDRSIIVWEREESAQHMTVVGALRGHRRAVLCLATVGEMVCSGSADKTVRVWRRGGGNSHWCVAVLDGHRGPVKAISVAASPSFYGCFVYTGSLDHDIKLWCVSHDDDEDRPEKITF